jgi:hypothetical protein
MRFKPFRGLTESWGDVAVRAGTDIGDELVEEFMCLGTIPERSGQGFQGVISQLKKPGAFPEKRSPGRQMNEGAVVVENPLRHPMGFRTFENDVNETPVGTLRREIIPVIVWNPQ